MTEQEYFADDFKAGIMTPEEWEYCYTIDFSITETVSVPMSSSDTWSYRSGRLYDVEFPIVTTFSSMTLATTACSIDYDPNIVIMLDENAE